MGAIKFPRSIRVPIANHVDGRSYELVRASDVPRAPATFARLVHICSEPAIYDWLFRGPLGGEPYTEDKAREFLKWACDGWSAGTHFVFFVLDDKRSIAAACDIKSNDLVAEMGYWASQGHRGVMTNTVNALSGLAAKAGFQRLYARTREGNTRSQAVLLRARFSLVGDEPDGHARFELPLGA